MNKKIRLSILIIGIALITFIMISIYPKTIHLHAQGMKYRLGAEHIGDEKSVAIDMDGTVYTSLTGNKRFVGTITIEGEEIPVPEHQRQIEINLGKDLSGIMLYQYNEDKGISHFLYGTIFLNRSFREATFTVMDRDLEEGNQGGNWSGYDGIMITVPASDRAEALRISNHLMKEYLDGYILH
ncbi:hypothetical protein [Paenibacillus gallinarum]|uniref:Uncharacterized protein n=1 Tax=Paenibacillus gallinarum TaxID=2762232 RepID=A0ABR8ST59_9BACL|nr:hypothetical protein [Paenibacillus gallinarum]MBD7966680.1 hypothetical protein [Paenibacillus gallinarum]